jgi:hypothetical protein
LIESPSHVWNLDETAFFTDPRGVKATSAIGDKAYRIISGCGRSCFTALACVSAAGAVLPPLVIFEGKNSHSTWKGEKALPGTTYACSANGWMNTDIFLACFQNFLRHVKEHPLIVILDGHSTHINLRVIKEARDANVSLIKLPSHSTNLLQPLDVSCFRPLKLLWDKQLISFQRLHNFRNISKSQCVDILSSVWRDGLSESNVRSGFRKCGIFPLNRCMYPKTAFIISSVYSTHAIYFCNNSP